jgi:hypothetical protein
MKTQSEFGRSVSAVSAFSAISLVAMSALLSACGPGRSADEVAALPQAAYGNAALAATKIWKVKADVLNCRAAPGTAAGVVFDLRKGSVVDVVDATRTQKNGFTWIHVNPRGDIDHNNCYLAADDRFLTPANGIDADNYDVGAIYEATTLNVKAPLNCREAPGVAAGIIFSAMPVGTVLDPVVGEFYVTWADDAWWIHVDPRGDTDHNTCWISARKSNVTLVP